MNFSLIEKLALIKSLDELMLANEVIAPGELKYLEEVMAELDFSPDFIYEARKLYSEDCIEILGRMDWKKKKLFSEMLHEMAISDGYADESEINLIIGLYESMGLNREKEAEVRDFPNMNYLVFEAGIQYVYSCGFDGERTHSQRPVTVKIEAIVYEHNLFKVSIFEESKVPKLWGLDVIFPTKVMEVVQDTLNPIELIASETKQAIQIFHKGPDVKRIRFSDRDRSIYMEYSN